MQFIWMNRTYISSRDACVFEWIRILGKKDADKTSFTTFYCFMLHNGVGSIVLEIQHLNVVLVVETIWFSNYFNTHYIFLECASFCLVYGTLCYAYGCYCHWYSLLSNPLQFNFAYQRVLYAHFQLLTFSNSSFLEILAADMFLQMCDCLAFLII